MAKKRQRNDRLKKLLDFWTPPQGVGDPVGCLATSFTFDSVFFEEECLGRFVGLQSDPVEDGAVYMIEREEKLGGVCCAAALVDQHHCKGNRSLRWDLIPIRIAHGIFHPKMAILAWRHRIRLFISSANLTVRGYRQNQEIFGTMDYYPGSDASQICLNGAIDFLEEALQLSGANADDSPEITRCRDFLSRVQEIIRPWSSPAGKTSTRSARVHTIFSAPGRASVFDQLKSIWGDGQPPFRAELVSPFFDQEDIGRSDRVSNGLWKILRRRGEATVTYNMTCRQLDDGSGIVVNAPYSSIRKAVPTGRIGVGIAFSEIRENFESDKENDWGFRPLHLKALWLENDRKAYLLVGSSNFTSAGYGLGETGYKNFEANFLYSLERIGKDRDDLRARLPAGTKLDESMIRGGSSADLSEEDTAPDRELLPGFFLNAIYSTKEGKDPKLQLMFDKNKHKETLAGWHIETDTHQQVYAERRWIREREPDFASVNCPEGPPPSGLNVLWKDAEQAVWWPVVVDTPSSLPPPAELKNLPLEVLINVLSSARPAHQILRDWLRRQDRQKGNTPKVILDPHKRVDVSGFILQRTRKVSWALSCLRIRLERPAATREQMHWRLRGPIGIEALAKAIIAEAKTDQECAFLTTELALELSRVNPQEATGCLSVGEIQKEIFELITELREKVYEDKLGKNSSLRRYIDTAFRMIGV